MASFYGNNYTDAFVDVPASKVDVSKWGGRLRVMYDDFDLAAVLALNDKLYLGKLPKGAIVYDAILSFPDLGTAGVVDLGYEYDDSSLTSDPNAYLDAVDVNAAADTVRMSDEADIVGFGLELSGDAKVVLTATTATTAVAGKIRCALYYVVD